MPRNDALWTDYDGDEPYVDYLVNASDGQPVNQRRYLPGLGHFDDVTGTTAYVHGDQVGTLRRLTDGVTGATLLRRVHTAFGQQALSEGPTSTRYGYAGAFGYESFGFADLPFIHVGERWYDPASGRFLQRDPIGIVGGLNTYCYVHGNPTSGVDPRGLFNDWAFGDLPAGWKPGGLTNPPTPPSPVSRPWPDTNSEQEARDIANCASFAIAAVAAFGGPVGWTVGGLSLIVPWVHDWYERYRKGLYED